MTGIHPVSQAEADRVFSPADREAAAARFYKTLRNARQRFKRNMDLADDLLKHFDKKSGTLWDLVEREVYAERAQLNAMEVHGVEATMKALMP